MTGVNKRPPKLKEARGSQFRRSKFKLTIRILKRLRLEDKGHIGSQARLFSSNLKHDYLCFLATNSDIKIINTKNGKYVGEIDGAHFKGTYNFGLVVSSGL